MPLSHCWAVAQTLESTWLSQSGYRGAAVTAFGLITKPQVAYWPWGLPERFPSHTSGTAQALSLQSPIPLFLRLQYPIARPSLVQKGKNAAQYSSLGFRFPGPPAAVCSCFFSLSEQAWHLHPESPQVLYLGRFHTRSPPPTRQRK